MNVPRGPVPVKCPFPVSQRGSTITHGWCDQSSDQERHGQGQSCEVVESSRSRVTRLRPGLCLPARGLSGPMWLRLRLVRVECVDNCLPCFGGGGVSGCCLGVPLGARLVVDQR